MAEKNLWILTEERPKISVLQKIFEYFSKDKEKGYFEEPLRIIPLLDEFKRFTFTYEVFGFKCPCVNRIFIKTVSGSSSFVDFLIFHQKEQPSIEDIPLYAIEETKTDDSESRNTGVYQRCSKFVFIQNFFPSTKKIMLYELQVEQKEKPTETSIFGTRMLMTLGVDIVGKELNKNIFRPFDTIDELIAAKREMRKPPQGNVPILLTRFDNRIEVSGRLYKDERLAHDPNIGALSIISAVLRKLGWKGPIVITQHGLQQEHVGSTNKFVQIANKLNISLEGLVVPHAELPKDYWHYEKKGEKLGTIFIHLVVENFTKSKSIFENHAGCEKGYFQTSAEEFIPLQKYVDKDAYKAGDKDQIVFIPDLVLLDKADNEIITIEGKKHKNRSKGIKELKLYDAFDRLYLKPYYRNFKIFRTVVLYGSKQEQIKESEVGFLLNENGKFILGDKAPNLFKKAIANLLDYWK